MSIRRGVDAALVRESLDYDPATGIMTWRFVSKYHSEKNGTQAGCPVPKKNKYYHVICLGGKKWGRSVLAFAWMTGEWPQAMIDHRDGDGLNDRWKNLREATALQNAQNMKRMTKKSPLPMGVRETRYGKYVARIREAGTAFHIGVFATPDQASAAYRAERKRRFGEFA